MSFTPCARIWNSLSRATSRPSSLAAGVLASQENAWGKVKKSLRRPRGPVRLPAASLPVAPSTSASVEDTVATFVSDHEEGWSFEEETALREDLATIGHDASDSRVDAVLDEGLRSKEPEASRTVPPMIQHTEATPTHSLETETALMELRERAAEVNAFARDFLMVSSTTNQADMEAFIHSLRGLRVSPPTCLLFIKRWRR